MTDCDDCLAVREAEHRISNHLTMLSGLVHLKATALAKGTDRGHNAAALALSEIRAHLDAVARLHRALAAKGGTRAMDLGEYLEQAVTALASAQGCTDLALEVEPGCVVPVADVLAVTQIVIEAVTNALKHGKGPVKVRCLRPNGGAIIVEVADCGPSLPPGLDPRSCKGMGMSLIRRLGEQIGAKADFLTNHRGTIVRLALADAMVGERARL